MRGWNQFGVIETIYEEEHEFSSSSSFSSSPPSLHSLVNAWSLDFGAEANILIHVQGTSFRLHKEVMISQSSYLKRHLAGVSSLTLSPPLNITAETFTAVAEFCYGRRVQLTAGNVAAVRTAAELLGMREGENLCEVAESYLEGVLGIDASTVLRSCLSLLPEAETTASLASRCMETLIREGDFRCLNDVVVQMKPQDFQTVAYSLSERLPHHDVLYKMVDLYLKENEHGKVTEEDKRHVCNSIDCTKLSPQTLMDCVQNPQMPLRFIVRAILVEHLNTRRSVAAAATAQVRERTSLGDILNRDTARRQTARIKEAMDSTYSRIQRLEKELSGMRRILQEEEEEEEEEEEQKLNVLNSERSASFHYFVPCDDESSKIERGGRGSVSSSGFVLTSGVAKKDNQTKKNASLGHKFIAGLKNAFRISNSSKAK